MRQNMVRETETLDRRIRGLNIFNELDFAHESTKKGLRDDELVRLGVKRIAEPVPGKSVRRGDKVPDFVRKRALYLANFEPEIPRQKVEEMLDIYDEHLAAQDAYDKVTAQTVLWFLDSVAPTYVSRLVDMEISFLERQNVLWLGEHCKYLDAGIFGQPVSQKDYQNATRRLQKSFTDFMKVHGSKQSIVERYEIMNQFRRDP